VPRKQRGRKFRKKEKKMKKLSFFFFIVVLALLGSACTRSAATQPAFKAVKGAAVLQQTPQTATPAALTSEPEVSPTPSATPSPTATAAGLETATPAAVAACPTDAQMWAMVGLPDNVRPVFHGEGVAWDACQWQWQAYATDVAITLPLPADWQATVTLSDGTVAVYRGQSDLKVQDVAGFNLRYTPAYPADHWVNSDCALLAQELSFGLRRDPAYTTVEGNLICSDMAEIDTSVCPSTTAQVAALVGGDPDQWSAPDWELGAWVFKAQNGQFVKLSVPSSLQGAADIVRLDYWNGQSNAADSLAPGEGGLALNEASFHCHAAQ
jgi:hypothetical protein